LQYKSNYSRWTTLRLAINFIALLLILFAYQRLSHKAPAQAEGVNPSLGFAEGEFRELNKNYFNNTLPFPTITWFYNPNERAETEQTANGYVIKLNPAYNKTETQMAMDIYHEACHIKTYQDMIEDPNLLFENQHGPHWQSCMKDLAKRNAFALIW